MEPDTSRPVADEQLPVTKEITDATETECPAPDYAVSVVICTRNRRADLNLTLDTLETQKWDGRWEILVVDNGSTDGTLKDVAERVKTFPIPLRAVREKTPGLSHARNRGLHEALGKAVVFIDDDVNCREGWVAAHGRAFMDRRICGTAGRIIPLLPPGTGDEMRVILNSEIGGPTSRYDFGTETGRVGKLKLPLPFGANMGVRRWVALQVGGFRTDMGWGKRKIPSEDVEFFRRVRAAQRGAIWYVPTATVEHRIALQRTTYTYYKRWQRSYGRALALIDDPPQSPREYWQRIVSQWSEVKKNRRSARMAGEPRRDTRAIEAARELERSRGYMLELIRLFFTSYLSGSLKSILKEWLRIT